jgi:ComF family protein
MLLAKVDSALARLFPRRCILCGAHSGDLNCCPGCLGDLPWINVACRRCGDVLPADYGGEICGHCPILAPGIDRIVSALVYEYPIDRLVAMAKFQRRIDTAFALGELLANCLFDRFIAGDLAMPDLIVPVPLHPRRIAQRGFNQAKEIAGPVARKLDVPLETRACRRIRNTVEQSRISAAERLKNMRNAFNVSEDLDGSNIAIVDDVITTGSTAGALARCLHNAGARYIQIWTVARTVNPDTGRRRLLAAAIE